jgi:hypothetical protein
MIVGQAHQVMVEREQAVSAEQPRHPLLKAIDARVRAVDVVAHLGIRHRLAHAGRRAGHGVTAEVDAAHPPKVATQGPETGEVVAHFPRAGSQAQRLART